MKKILAYVMALLFVLTIFSGINLNVALANVSILDITVSPNTAGSHAEYKITIKPSANVNIGQKVYIKFPSAYSLPATINTNSVYIAGNHPSAISIDSSNVITLTVAGAGLVINEHVLIDFYSSAGIVNPTTPSTYSIEVWTETEPSHTTGSFVITAGGGSGNSVTGLTVYVSPADSGKAADYTLMFNVTNNGALTYSNNDYVDVYFPAGTTMPANPDPSKVRMKTFPCTSVNISGTRVRVYVPSALGLIAPGAQCNIEFTKDFGIKNPESPGDYALQVSTSKDTGLATSNLYHITGTSISDVSVTVTPSSQLTVAEYRIVFKTSSSGSLTKNLDKINIIFPDEVTLPTTVIPGAITVNNTPCVNATIVGNKLSITTPVSISVNSQVTVIISQNFGIKNPSSTGSYNISVYTSKDTSSVDVSFTITTSQITQPTVQLSTTSAGAVCAYTISFTTGASGALSGGVDKINVIFPVGTTMPDSISTSAVTVNNIPTTNVQVNGTTVTITVPISIPANYTITVVISESANIKNPITAGTYTLYVNTTKETSSVASAPYTIFIVPLTQLVITPPHPDGLNGYYKTQPRVVFSATSPIDTNPFVYYYFDNNQATLYNGQPITVPEGIHTLFYYAVDHQGHQEQVKSTQFKVDTVPPQLVISSPKDNAVLNSKNVSVNGTVDIGATVSVNGKAATVDSAGHFVANVKISGNSAVITIVAKDIAGNTAQKVLHVSVDTTPPKLTVTTPLPFQEIHKLPVIVKGVTEPGAIVTVNDNPVSVDKDGNFSFALSDLTEGKLSIINVVAKDAAGNTTKKMINVKYIKTTIVKLQINNTTALINTNTVKLDSPPVIKDGRTLVPLRFVSEAFGAKLTWDPIFQIIDITLGSDVIRLQIGKNFASVNGKKVMLDVAPVIINGRTMVPIRFISESLDSQVLWDGETKTVTIVYPKPKGD